MARRPTSKTVREAATAVSRWAAEGFPKPGGGRPAFAHAVIRALRKLYDEINVAPGVYWRGTNNKDEVRLLRQGVQLTSVNHATGQREIGLSVSETPATLWAYNYKFAYKVSGDVVGAGSDGEPLLTNVVPLSGLSKASAIVQRDRGPWYWWDALRSIGSATGVEPRTLDWVMYQ